MPSMRSWIRPLPIDTNVSIPPRADQRLERHLVQRRLDRDQREVELAVQLVDALDHLQRTGGAVVDDEAGLAHRGGVLGVGVEHDHVGGELARR